MHIITKLLDYIFPRQCIFCGTPVYSGLPYCEDCIDLIPFTEDVCPVCGKESCICNKQQFYFQKAVSVFNYDLGAEHAIRQLKFNEKISYAKPLAGYMYQKMLQSDFINKIQLILPAPMTKKDTIARGYNQSVLLAKELSRLSHIPMSDRILLKVKQTRKQHDLNSEERKINLSDAFRVTDSVLVSGKTILLCDDVYTTGSTFNECSRILMENGAKEVYCIAAASTQLKQLKQK